MGEQRRRKAGGEDFMERSIHAALAWHRDMRGHYRARGFLDTLYFSCTDLRPAATIIAFKNAKARRKALFRKWSRKGRESRIKWLRYVQSNRCYLCDQPFTIRNAPTEDHVRPWSQTRVTHGNVCLAHSDCNHRKGDRPPFGCELVYLEAVNAQIIAIKGQEKVAA
jgi:hypothetical protein